MTKYDFDIVTHNKYDYNLLIYYNNGYYNISSVSFEDDCIYIKFSYEFESFIKCTVGEIKSQIEKFCITYSSKDVPLKVKIDNVVYDCEISIKSCSVVILNVVESSEKGSKLSLKECDYTNFKFLKNTISLDIEREKDFSISIPIDDETPKKLLNLLRDIVHHEVNSCYTKQFPSIYLLYMNAMFKVIYVSNSKPKIFLSLDIFDDDNKHWINGDFYINEDVSYYQLLLEYVRYSVSGLLFSFDSASDFKCGFKC